MTGVASMNESRAASSWSSPRRRPATIVTPERLIPAKEAFAREEDEPVDREEDGRRGRLGEHGAEAVLEDQPDDAHGNRPEHEEPGHALRRGLDAPMRDRGEEPTDDRDPVAPVEHQERDGGGDVQADEERQVERLVGRLTGDEGVP